MKDIGKIVKFNGKEEVENWGDGGCNKILGTDATIFPPFLEIDEGLWNFQPGMCRSLRGEFRQTSKYKGIRANRYYLDFGDIANKPELQCFCREPGICPLKGTMDLFPCVGSPIVLSLPHFYDGNF